MTASRGIAAVGTVEVAGGLKAIELGTSYPNEPSTPCLYPDVRDGVASWRDAAPCASRYPGPGPIGPSDASRFRYRKACDASRLDYVVTVMRHGLLETHYVIEHHDPGPHGS